MHDKVTAQGVKLVNLKEDNDIVVGTQKIEAVAEEPQPLVP